jgi:hypothetical protein
MAARGKAFLFYGGTESSNPLSSTGESAANQTSSMRVPKRKLLGYLPHLFDAVVDIKQQRRRMIDPPPPD